VTTSVEAPVQEIAVVDRSPMVKTAAYTIQIASFKDKKRAEEALVGIQAKVPSAYIASRDLGEKGVWYRIYAGQFERQNDAEVTLSDIKQNYDSSFIISPKRAR
jgi:cell division septation protein DedD